MTAPLGFLGLFGDAIDFIFDGTDSVAAGQHVGGTRQVAYLTKEHLKVTFLALGLSLASRFRPGICSGTVAAGERRVALGNAGRAIPELAVIALLASLLDGRPTHW